MSSGMKDLRINTQERAMSEDINRLQKFKSADVAELFRFMYDVDTGADDIYAGGLATEHTTTSSPLRATVMSGLLVTPHNGSLNLLVSKGVMYAVLTNADVDSSVYKYVRDAGVTSLGALTVPSNAGGGSATVSIVECSVTESVIETAVRDIYDTTAQVFNATSVTKVVADVLTYRVRTGSVGGGIPSTASGWLPLAVISAPAGAATLDAMTMWDVRPLLSDRVLSLNGQGYNRPKFGQCMVNALPPYTAVQGLVEATYMGARIGGDLGGLDVTAAANQDGGGFTANRPWYVYLCFPAGLPRWAKYSPSGARTPVNPRGIPVVSKTAPTTFGIGVSIALPAACGLGGSADGVAVFASYTAPAGGQSGAWSTSDGKTFLADSNVPEADRPMDVAGVTAGTNPGVATYSLTAGVHYPTHATEILCEFRADISNTTAHKLRQLLCIYAPNGGAQMTSICVSNQTGSDGALTVENDDAGTAWALAWVPLPSVYPVKIAPTQVIAMAYLNGDGAAMGGFGAGGAQVRILGWKLG